MLRKVVLLAVMLASNLLRDPNPKPEPTGGAYELFLELPVQLPVQVVLALLWLFGAALIGLLLVALYPSYWLA